MKQICVVLFFLIPALPSFCGADGAELKLWSGKWCELPGQGDWQVVAKHGRVLAAGNGNIRFQIPALRAGSSLDAVLSLNGKNQKLCFYSPRILTGISAATHDLKLKYEKSLQTLGVSIDPQKAREISFAGHMAEGHPGTLLFVFTEKKDFPLKLCGEWTRISLHRSKKSGSLSVLYNAKEKLIDSDGECAYIRLERNDRAVIVFSPDFDMEDIENALLIKHIIENNIPNKGVEK